MGRPGLAGEFVQLAAAALAGFLVDLAAITPTAFRCRAEGHWVGAGCYGLDAFAVEPGPGRWRGGAVAGYVGVFEATSRTIWRPCSRGSLSSISLATVTPSLVMWRTEFLFDHYIAALGRG